MEKSDRDISQWDARLKEQLERSFHNYHKRRIDLSVARDNKQLNWTGENLIVEKASSSTAIATVRLMFEDADPLTLAENIEIKSIFNRLYLTNAAQADEWLDVIAGINFEYKKKVEGGGGLIYYDRGDIAGHDWTLADFTRDNTWYDLDLSAIIPAGTVLVRLLLAIVANAGSQYGQFRTNGYVNLINIENRMTQVANVFFITTLWLYPDANGVIEYRFSNAVWATINISVAGWFV